MRDRMFIVALAATILSGLSIDLGACGDKYTRVGQSTRIKRWVSLHPSSILVYKPQKSSAAGVNFYKELLTGAGHKAEFIKYGTPIDKMIASGKFDVLLIHYADLPAVMAQIQSSRIKPVIVPILGEQSKGLAAQAEQEYPFLIEPEKMDPFMALGRIDQSLEQRIKSGTQ